MTKIEYIYESFKKLKSGSIYEILDTLEIEINYNPLLIPHRRDSMIICDGSHTAIFLRPITDTNYREFLLWHELGHYVLHYNPRMKMNYALSTYKDRYEQEANLFAVFGILAHADLSDRHGIDAAISGGVPAVVASDIFRLLQANNYTMK